MVVMAIMMMMTMKILITRMKEDTNLPDESIAQLGDSCEGVAPQLQPVPQAKIVRGTNFPASWMEGEDDVGGGIGHIMVNPMIS